jgi:hypothetical protein
MSDLVGVQEVRWEVSGTDRAGEYTSFYGKRNENHEFGTVLFVQERIISAVKKVEFVSDRIKKQTPWPLLRKGTIPS